MLPTFLVIGAMKAGTTSLAEYLSAHPEIFLTAEKEPHFFSFRDRQALGLEWYESLFDRADGAIARGEASTTYTKYPQYAGVAQRIAEHLPDARLIYIIRDPIDRIRSQYQHHVAIGIERAPFEEAVLENPYYVDFSRYACQIEQYLEHFPREQLLIVTSEDLRRERVATLGKVYDFVGVDEGVAHTVPAEEHFTTEGRLAYPAVVASTRRALRRVWPGSVGVAKFIPGPVKQLLGKSMVSQSSGLAMTGAVRKRLEDALREDVTRLRNYMPPGFDGWGIA